MRLSGFGDCQGPSGAGRWGQEAGLKHLSQAYSQVIAHKLVPGVSQVYSTQLDQYGAGLGRLIGHSCGVWEQVRAIGRGKYHSWTHLNWYIRSPRHMV